MSHSAELLLTPDELMKANCLTKNALEQLDKILLGRSSLHKMVMAGVLSRGHMLLEGLPGLGKTALIKAIGDILNLTFKRVQFTPDLMPADILGSHILQETTAGREMVFHPGPVFTNILLADEINRASPKTQSAMLETMQERSVTLMGTTRKLPSPFLVLASQNPIELEGTYPLPEAQLDRFMFRLMIKSVDVDVLNDIISSRRRGEPPGPSWTMSSDELNMLFSIMDKMYLPRPVSRYIARLVAATHAGSKEATDSVRNYVTYGASPRAAIAVAEGARAWALLSGRPTVGFEDVKSVATAVMNHRIILNYKARFDKKDPVSLLEDLLAQTPEVETDLPSDVSISRPLD